jgi:hypothetical protein
MAYLEMNNALGGKVPKSANRIIFALFTKIKTCHAAAGLNRGGGARRMCKKRFSGFTAAAAARSLFVWNTHSKNTTKYIMLHGKRPRHLV